MGAGRRFGGRSLWRRGFFDGGGKGREGWVSVGDVGVYCD